jgi:protein-disulfide isomerase
MLPKTSKFLLLPATLLVSSAVALNQANAEISEADFSAAMTKYLDTSSGREIVAKTVEKYFQEKQLEQQKKQAEAEQKEIEEAFKNPVKLEIGKSPVAGPEGAKITVFEFSDFECPYCSRGGAVVKQLMQAYPNDVKVVFKHLPLGFHKNAKPAAIASLAANQQGKFWEFHDELFANQQSLSDEFYIKTAEKLGLDLAKFKADLNSPELSKQVDEDSALAAKHGIQGTPGFFVGGVPVRGAYPLEHFKKIVDKLLGK